MNPELLKRLDPIARRFGLYTAYTLDESEHVGDIPLQIALYLSKYGYEELPTVAGISLEAAKLHPENGKPHDWSYRKIDPENPRKQFHIHGWDHFEAGYHEIYSHRELRPDFKRINGETLGEMKTRLKTHYRPTYGRDYQQGKMCDDLDDLLRSR